MGGWQAGWPPPPRPPRPQRHSLHDVGHLLLQAVEGAEHGGQHVLEVVGVVHLRRPQSQDVLVVPGVELPQAPHVPVFGLLPLLPCGTHQGGEGRGEGQASRAAGAAPAAVPWEGAAPGQGRGEEGSSPWGLWGCAVSWLGLRRGTCPLLPGQGGGLLLRRLCAHSPLLASWNLRLAWALSRMWARYWAFRRSGSC